MDLVSDTTLLIMEVYEYAQRLGGKGFIPSLQLYKFEMAKRCLDEGDVERVGISFKLSRVVVVLCMHQM